MRDCKYAFRYPGGSIRCAGTREMDPCLGFDKCDSYKDSGEVVRLIDANALIKELIRRGYYSAVVKKTIEDMTTIKLK